jgi:hypothetical protein
MKKGWSPEIQNLQIPRYIGGKPNTVPNAKFRVPGFGSRSVLH